MRSRRPGLAVAFGLLLLAACERSVVAPPPSDGAPRGVAVDTSRLRPSFSYSALASGLLISPIGLDFGEIQVGSTAAAQAVTITNIAGTPVIMSGAGGAPPSGHFGGVQTCQGLTLSPDASCTMSFAFSPTAAGFQSDASIGTWNGQAFTIELRGTGVAPHFQIVQTALDFGEVQVGSTSPSQSVIIINAGNAPVVMSGAGGAPPTGKFGGVQSCQGLTLTPGASCSMSFAFSPSAVGDLTDASIGSWNGQNFNIALHGVGVGPSITVSPTSLDFGEVAVGTTSAAQSVTVRNSGATPVIMSGAGGAPPTGKFGGVQTCQGLTLAPGASCSMSFAFSPSATGLLTDASIGSWNGVPFNVALRGVGINPGTLPSNQFLITPLALDFGDVTIGGTSPTQSVTIKNVGTAAITMSGAGGAPPTGKFGGVQSCQGLSLAPGATCEMSFAFTPNAAGELTDASVGSWNGVAFNIALRGNGTNPVFRVSPTGIDFGDVQVGSHGPNQNVTITNLSPITITMSGAGGAPPTGKFGGVQACQGIALATGASCQMTFAFSPSDPGVLTDASVGSWNGQAFHVDFRGNGAAPKFLITPFALDFGLVPVGITGPSQNVKIINAGLDAVVMSGAGGAPPTGHFGGVQTCQGLTIARGASCQMSFAFSPVAAGLLTDASIGTWNAQPFNIALQGTGFSDVANVDMDLSPATISLTGTVTTSAVLLSSPTFDARTVTLANVRMLVNGTTDVAPVSRGGVVVSSTRDWNGDGLIDRMFSFQTNALAAAGLHTGAGADALILRDNISASKWRARDGAPPTFVP